MRSFGAAMAVVEGGGGGHCDGGGDCCCDGGFGSLGRERGTDIVVLFRRGSFLVDELILNVQSRRGAHQVISYRVGIQYQVLNVIRSVSVCIRRCLVSDSGEN